MGLFDSPVRDAKKIQETIDYRVLRAAWDGYVRLKKSDFADVHQSATPAWFALYAIINYNGNFKKFEPDELHQLEAFTKVPQTYELILQELTEHQQDEAFIKQVLATHPNLMEAIPQEYFDEGKVGSYLIATVSKYKKMLHNYYETHQKKIDATIEKLRG